MLVRPFDLASDITDVHAWVTSGKAPYWGMEDATLADVENQYSQMIASTDQQPWTGCQNGHALFVIETYHVPNSPLATLWDYRPGDVGFHFLLQRSNKRIKGLSIAAFGAALAFTIQCFGAARVVVEPDWHNTAMRQLNRRAGFTEVSQVSLPDKTAALSVCAAEDFWASDVAKCAVAGDQPNPRPAHADKLAFALGGHQ